MPRSPTNTHDEAHILQKALQFIFNPAEFSITEPSFADDGVVYKLPSHPIYQTSLGKKICIIDVDTRSFDLENQIMYKGPFSWESFQFYSAGIMNHYTYAMTHGYDYKFIHAANFTDRSPTWIKPSAIANLLEEYKFVIFLDADAMFNHMQIPVEWLLNYWQITSDISLAMALDPVVTDGTNNDTHGRLYTNTGFIIAQQNARTQEILRAWHECPDDVRYPGCSEWKNPRFHEQSAFGTYVRYDYEANIKELPCAEANGEPDFEQCPGTFVTHFWWRTYSEKDYFQQTVMQALTGRIQKMYVDHQKDIVRKQSKNEIL
ncbi:hypothetical protein K432DRAFT_293973 [Lepidopterella palustris CBS 459.81]|uniref:Nucleotide-diphospho-sugar transferase domain-containing protein n=1 Tax=Lepidopterella palustris CBS 459.81 TaxID=1314670 RepID=A0A8E2EE11_9PEZI|nr:hypothetical protein K432DRAFT_293973 [Lepidopterella palustris CBS 459.81]